MGRGRGRSPGEQMSLQSKIVALVLGLTAAILAGLGLFLAGSWSRWAARVVEHELEGRATTIATLVEIDKSGEIELEGEEEPLLADTARPFRLEGREGVIVGTAFDWPALEPARDRRQWVETFRDGAGRRWRVLSRAIVPAKDKRRGGSATPDLVLRVAAAEEPFEALEHLFRRGLLAALLAALLLGGASAALLVRLSLAPLRRLATEVGAIGSTSLDRRLATAGLDPELARLAAAFNGLMDRLGQFIDHQRRFVSRASHALRTPTATILTRAEVALRRDRTAAEYRDALGDIALAAKESAALVGHLLALGRLDEGGRTLRFEEVPLAGVATDLTRLFAARAVDAGIALELEVPPDVAVAADRAALRELLEALLDNALRYTPRGGRVGFRAAARGDGVELVVWDTGPGIAPEERLHAFERFYRGSAADAAGAAGSGLGLPIAKAIADGHGATLSLEDREGGGLAVIVRFKGSQARACEKIALRLPVRVSPGSQPQ